MRFPKKGQGISLNVIIIAAIALIVLVVLVMIFTGRMNIFGTGIKSATEQYCIDQELRQGAQIRDATEGCDDTRNERQVYGSFVDVPAGSICCVPS